MKIKITLDSGAYRPERAHDTDAGLDLRTREGVIIWPMSSSVIDTGIHMAIPEGYYGKLEGKSGLNINHGIVSLGGVIDSGYTGSIKAKLYNLSTEPYTFHTGEKVVQLIIQPCVTDTELILVDDLEETERGDKGFGSTGR